MNKEIRPAPQPKETLSKPEKLLSEATTGAQALLLLGLEPPKPNTPVLTVEEKQLFKHAMEGIPSDHKTRLKTASFNERDDYWEKKTDIPKDKQMDEWRKNI